MGQRKEEEEHRPMNLQQLRYVIAVNRFRNFAKAADACNVSQPTLSAMLQKLEEELDIRIFERSNKSVTPTTIGEKIILQAKKVLQETDRIGEIISEDKGLVGGKLTLSVGSTIAPYILPKFIKNYQESFPSVELSIQELKANFMINALMSGELDAGIAISGNVREGVLEVPLYTENFLVYLAESCWRKLPIFKPENLEHENMWIMKDAQCLRDSAFSFCKTRSMGNYIYEAGSISTLVHIVDENGGFTIIPEMHLPFLNEQQRKNVRPIEGDYLSQRRVSLYIKKDYIRQRMLNTIIDTLKKFMPKGMLSEGIQKYGIKL
jgi:LysR family hydrogen peroxide-inducible transcriptional activator